jgi:sugar phosphate isomerase/epimerase
MLRRTFLQAVPAAVSAAAPLPEALPGRGIRLGIDTYSIRAYRWKAMRLLDYAAGLKLDAVHISSLDEYESLDPAHLAKVKDRAARLGLSIDAGIGCICPRDPEGRPKMEGVDRYLVQGLSVAQAVGSSVMRCYMGAADYRRGPLPLEAYMEATVKALRAVRSRALDTGVRIAIENHSGDLQGREVKTLIEEAGADFTGACLDTGNPIWAVEDPLVTLEVLSSHIVTSHFRDSVVWEHPRGAAGQWTALGDGSLDLPLLAARFRELCPKAAMQLEIITGRPPQVLPYLEPAFWKAFPKTPASEFARFVALARRGRPFMGTMVIAGPGKPSPELDAALREQQRIDLERSLAYARQTLGAGLRRPA